jgi:hypothetical protein
MRRDRRASIKKTRAGGEASQSKGLTQGDVKAWRR